MIEIIPAIMPDSYDDLLQKVGRVKGIVSHAQIDVMDGKFVPTTSWPYDKEGQAQFKTMIENGDMLPLWEEIDYEIDLMVEHPEKVVEDWVALGARRIIIHLESTERPKEIIEFLEKRLDEEEELMGIAPVELGVAISTKTSLEILFPLMHDIDVVQFMGINKIGYQGELFEESVTERIKNLREECPHLIISVDGGVSFETAPQLIKAGASRLVSGSTVFESNNIRGTISRLKQI